jgi:hypothetical protein
MLNYTRLSSVGVAGERPYTVLYLQEFKPTSSKWINAIQVGTTNDTTASLDTIGSYVVYGWIRAGIGGTPSS